MHLDDDIVVVDKPAGVAAHPSPGWHGPTVISALMGEGISVATSGAAERQGIVHRLDVGTSGTDGRSPQRTRLHRTQASLQGTHRGQGLPHPRAGMPDPLRGTIDAPIDRHPGNEWKFAVVEDGRNSITHYDVLEAFSTHPW